MMRQSSIFFLFILFFLFMIFPSATSWCTNLVDDTCQNYSRSRVYLQDPTPDYNAFAYHYNFCKASLEAVPASRCTDLRGLGFIAINLLRYNTTNTQWHIRGLLGRKRLDEPSKRHLESCLHLYRDNAKALTEVLKEYVAGKLEDAAGHVASVMISAANCEYGLHFRGLHTPWDSPLTKQNFDASQLATISLSIMDMQKS